MKMSKFLSFSITGDSLNRNAEKLYVMPKGEKILSCEK